MAMPSGPGAGAGSAGGSAGLYLAFPGWARRRCRCWCWSRAWLGGCSPWPAPACGVPKDPG